MLLKSYKLELLFIFNKFRFMIEFFFCFFNLLKSLMSTWQLFLEFFQNFFLFWILQIFLLFFCMTLFYFFSFIIKSTKSNKLLKHFISLYLECLNQSWIVLKLNWSTVNFNKLISLSYVKCLSQKQSKI